MFSRVLCLLSAGVLLAQPAADPKDTARKALDLLLAHKYSDIGPLISQNSKAANTEAELAKKVSDAWGPCRPSACRPSACSGLPAWSPFR
jgi:hypothetical protein